MTRALVILVGGLTMSLLGTATATDAISLREVMHGLPLVSYVVIATREAMGTGLAHALEPACGVLGGGVMRLALRFSPTKAIRTLVPVRA